MLSAPGPTRRTPLALARQRFPNSREPEPGDASRHSTRSRASLPPFEARRGSGALPELAARGALAGLRRRASSISCEPQLAPSNGVFGAFTSLICAAEGSGRASSRPARKDSCGHEERARPRSRRRRLFRPRGKWRCVSSLFSDGESPRSRCRASYGGRGTRTPKRLRAAVFKTAALPIRTIPPPSR